MATPADLPYRLGRAERRGSVFGWRPGQAVAVACGFAGLVGCVGTGGAAGAVLGVIALSLGAAVAAAPLAGRGIDEWVPVVAQFAVRSRGRALCQGGAVQPADGAARPARLMWPDGTATTIATVHHRGLRALSDDPRALGEAMATWLRGMGGSVARDWVVTMVTVTGPGTTARTAPWADPGARTDTLVAVTSAVPVSVSSALLAAGIAGAADLDEAGLDDLLARRVAPAAGSLLDCDLRVLWHRLEGPTSSHAAFVVEEWPAGDLDEQALAPLVVSRDRRTVAISLRVEELRRARSRTARSRTAAAADDELAERGGFLASPESARASSRDAERAGELAAGHGSVRLVGAVSLDASDALELEAAATRLLTDATACGVRLRRCDGDHVRGVLATVPGWCAP